MKNVIMKIVQDFKVLSEDFQVLADDFYILSRMEQKLNDDQGNRIMEMKRNDDADEKSRQAEENMAVNHGLDEGMGQSIRSGQNIRSEQYEESGQDIKNKQDTKNNQENDTDHNSENTAKSNSPSNCTAPDDKGSNLKNAAADKGKEIKIETVRAVLSQKTRSGKVKEVKELIKKYGADKLTALNPACYEKLLKEAENI